MTCAVEGSGRPPPCSADGCDRESDCRGMCSMHYMRWWRAERQDAVKVEAARITRLAAECDALRASKPFPEAGVTRLLATIVRQRARGITDEMCLAELERSSRPDKPT